MKRNLRNVEAAISFTSDGRLGTRFCRGGLTLLAALCLFIVPTVAKAA